MIEDTLGLCGTVVAEKYSVTAAVGVGGFAVVYRAEHLLWKRPVALKVFRVADASEEGLRTLTDNLVREASLLAELSEKTASICQARDLGVFKTAAGHSYPYMVLEWLDGQSLGQTLLDEQTARLPPRSVAATVELLEPVAEALAVAHARGIAHRDVKPGNIFLGRDAQTQRASVKLLDFGIAKVVQDAQETGGAFHQTAGVVTAFTPNYGAPEQFSRRYGATGPWTDVFAFAIILVECVAGRRVLVGDDFIEIANVAIDPARRPTPASFGVGVSAATEAVFARALAVNPQERYQTVGAFWLALCKSLGVEASRIIAASAEPPVSLAALPPSIGAPPPARPDPRKTSGKAVVAGGAAVVVLITLALGLGYRYVHGSATPPVARETVDAAASAPVAVASSSASAKPPARAACPDGMVLIPHGEFFMGSDEDSPGEKPAHHVEVSPYCIDIHEVTVAQYVACSDTGRCKRASKVNEWPGITAAEHEAYDPVCNVREPAARAQHPINCVDWDMADIYCHSLPGGRLPTEAEWEFAARGSNGRTFPWGDETPSAAHLNACGSECLAWAKAAHVTVEAMYPSDDGFPTTAPVGSFPQGKSPFGLLDVAGNVWEWVGDWQAPYASASLHDPVGPPTGKARVIRGGAWNGAASSWVRPTFRFANTPDAKSHGIGFRCAAVPR